jgi:DNA-binding response OmpR family regulator
MAAPSRIAEFSDLLRADEVHVLTSCVADAPAMTEQERPMLVLLEDTGDDRAVEACRAIHRLPGVGEGIPIVLVTPSEYRARAIDDAFTDILVEPYSPTYARTRVRAWLMREACRWVRAPKPNDEDRRLAATRALGLWDTPPEERFDRITRVAAALQRSPSLTPMDDHEWSFLLQAEICRASR